MGYIPIPDDPRKRNTSGWSSSCQPFSLLLMAEKLTRCVQHVIRCTLNPLSRIPVLRKIPSTNNTLSLVKNHNLVTTPAATVNIGPSWPTMCSWRRCSRGYLLRSNNSFFFFSFSNCRSKNHLQNYLTYPPITATSWYYSYFIHSSDYQSQQEVYYLLYSLLNLLPHFQGSYMYFEIGASGPIWQFFWCGSIGRLGIRLGSNFTPKKSLPSKLQIISDFLYKFLKNSKSIQSSTTPLGKVLGPKNCHG